MKVSHFFNLLSSSLKTSAHVAPVGDIEDSFYVIGSDVFVLKVVRVFPDIDAEQGNETGCGLKRILVGASRDLQPFLLRVVTEPAPT